MCISHNSIYGYSQNTLLWLQFGYREKTGKYKLLWYKELRKRFIFLSHYNLFNYLFPGSIYVIAVNHFTRLTLPTKNLWESFFLFYVIGLTISRIGSILVKPYLIEKLPCYPQEKEYGDFIEATKQDPKIDILLSWA